MRLCYNGASRAWSSRAAWSCDQEKWNRKKSQEITSWRPLRDLGPRLVTWLVKPWRIVASAKPPKVSSAEKTAHGMWHTSLQWGGKWGQVRASDGSKMGALSLFPHCSLLFIFELHLFVSHRWPPVFLQQDTCCFRVCGLRHSAQRAVPRQGIEDQTWSA